jgi:diguanylate cyclase (GGDEF)-like protein
MASARRSKRKNEIFPDKKIDNVNVIITDEINIDNSKKFDNLNSFTKEILDEISQHGLAITPKNFTFFFYKVLENQDKKFKEKILSTIDIEEDDNTESILDMEKNLKKGFVKVKEILNTNTNIYKNIQIMLKILEKRKNELNNVSNPKNIINMIEDDILKLNSILLKSNNNLKKIFDNTKEIISRVQEKTIFDSEYNIYNKRYLIELLKVEQKLIENFNHHSSLITVQLSQKKRDEITDPNIIKNLIKTISKLLLKTSRRSDIIAHYGSGIFMILLKHTNYSNAIKTSDRLKSLVLNTNLFFGDLEIILEVDIGIVEIFSNLEYTQIISTALKNMESSNLITNL